MSKYTPSVAVSKENGLKMTIPDPMTNNMLKNPEKTAFVDFEQSPRAKLPKGKTDNEQEIV